MSAAISLSLMSPVGQCTAATGQAASAGSSNSIGTMSALYSRGQYDQAEALGRQILKSSPTNLEAHYLMGNIYFKRGDMTVAGQQYDYCVKTGKNSPVAKMAATALAGIKVDSTSQSAESAAVEKATNPQGQSAAKPAAKSVSQAVLKHAESILVHAQENLAGKRKQLEAEMQHSEEHARSRIKDIPYNTIYRRMSAFAGVQAARDNEDYYTAPNYDRPLEVAKIRATETARIRRITEDYRAQENSIVAAALKETDALLGTATGADAVPLAASAQAAGAGANAATNAPSSTAEACADCGLTLHHETSGGQRVINVATGSAAHRAGMSAGDLIVQSTFIPGADLLRLTIRRQGKEYSLDLHPSSNQGIAAQHSSPKPAAPKAAQKLTNSQIAWNRIKDSEIVLVEDMSANMRQPLGETGLSKWDWAAGRILEFAETISKDSGATFSLAQCYQYVYEYYRDLNVAGLRQKLSAAVAMDAANLTTPIERISNEYFDSRNQKPLLLVILTDGHPERGESLEAAVKTILERAKGPDQVRMIFFQIGDDAQGTSQLQMLDHDLTYAGHKHDIVDVVRFDELQESGMSRALLDAYERPRSASRTVLPPASQALSSKLDEVRSQMRGAR